MIQDLYDDNGTMLNFQKFSDKYRLNVNFLEYLSIRSAVERYIRKTTVTSQALPATSCYIPFRMKDILKDKKGSKTIYTLINKNIISAKSQNNWNEIFENNELDWKTIYKIPAKSSKNTKLH